MGCHTSLVLFLCPTMGQNLVQSCICLLNIQTVMNFLDISQRAQARGLNQIYEIKLCTFSGHFGILNVGMHLHKTLCHIVHEHHVFKNNISTCYTKYVPLRILSKFDYFDILYLHTYLFTLTILSGMQNRSWKFKKEWGFKCKTVIETLFTI